MHLFSDGSRRRQGTFGNCCVSRDQTTPEKFQFGILEIADTNANRDDVRRREARWKELLLTGEHGYNAN